MRLTLSRLDLFTHCTWWTRPEVTRSTDRPCPETLRGRALHEAVERHQQAQPLDWPALARRHQLDPEGLARVQRWFGHWERSPLAGLPWRSEMAVSYRPESDSGRALPSNGRRDYSDVPLDEVPGTADLHLIAGELLVVLEIKTGDAAPAHAQLRGYALALARTNGLRRARVITARLGDAGLRTHEEDLSPAELDGIGRELRSRLAEPKRRARGVHCKARWCPAREGCEGR